MKMKMPSLEEWLELTEPERARRVAELNAYEGEGETLLQQATARFREEFGSLRGLAISGLGVHHGGSWVIGVSHPLIFDRRRVPTYYLGLPVNATVSQPLPEEFQGYAWAPENYERFVDRCSHEIRRELGRPEMSREEMLHALIGVPFEEHVANCRRRR
jgi:hypothetical protein